MHGHSHDDIDWDAQLRRLREADVLAAPETAELARTLLGPTDESVIDVGCGAGGAAAAFAAALSAGGAVTLVDSAQELLTAATAHARDAAASGVDVRSVRADLAGDDLSERLDRADLVFASFAVHHLPDQAAGLRRLVSRVRPGGRLALVEFGLPTRVLPWDVGVGEPGLEARLETVRDEWFRRMRADMPGSTRLPMGWPAALADAGLHRVRSWSYLIDRPPPVSGPALGAVLRRLEGLREAAREEAAAEDLRAVDQLLDADGPHYVGHRDDVGYLVADTVHVGTRPQS